MDERDLRELFENFGKVNSILMGYDVGKKIAFISMANREDAEKSASLIGQ